MHLSGTIISPIFEERDFFIEVLKAYDTGAPRANIFFSDVHKESKEAVYN